MSEYILAALLFGLTAGFQPGPLGIIVIQQTLERGLKHGLLASLAPIITDGPIIIVTLLVLTQFKNASVFIGLLSLVGGLYLIYLSLKLFNVQSIYMGYKSSPSKSLSTAVMVNFLSPTPYLFWFTVGGSFLIRGSQTQSIAFIITSVASLVLTKMFVAYLTSHFKNFLNGVAYKMVMRFLSVFLFSIGLVFLVRSYMNFF